MKKVLSKLVIILLVVFSEPLLAQIDTVFWFAAPWVTVGHANNVPVVLRLSSFNNPTQVRVRQPASTFDTTFTIPANSLVSESLSHLINQIENTPANTVLNRGIKITSDNPITAVYEVVTSGNNPETYSLKGQNGLGLEFVCPFQTNGFNWAFTPTAKSQIDIVASQNGTVVWITPRCNVVGHAAGVTYSISLNAGQSYNIENVTNNTNVAGQNLSGTIVVANKPISVSVTDDSVRGATGCMDLMGDQIVPVEVVGTQYIINKGGLSAGNFEGFYTVATENFTQITINDGAVTTQLLNKGDTYYYGVGQPLTYITSDKPVYVIHASGFGCELGEAIIPPLNCAGSDQVSFTRTNSQTFILNILCKTIATGNFLLNGSSTLVPASAFTVVPGTGGVWSGAQISFSTGQIGVGVTSLLKNTNATDNIFSMGVINGGATTGCLYHYMSSFLRKVITNAGADKNICTATTTISLNGTVEGGSTTGVWSTTNGTGTFGNVNNLNTTYTLSTNDLNQSQVKFVLSSTGNCVPVRDTMIVNIYKSPIVDAGANKTLCKNNISATAINGTLQFAAGANWTTTGSGSFGNPGALNTTYLPSPSDLSAGTIKLKLTSTGSLNGCPNTYDSLTFTFTNPPVVNVSPDVSICANNSTVAISGSVTVASTTGVWSGGTGSYNPGTTSLTNTYVPTASEIASGSVKLILTSTNNGNCKQVKDSILITFTSAPNVTAGADISSCKNNAGTLLNGGVSGPTSSGIWSGGTGTFSPANTTLNSLYTPSAAELSAGSVTLTLGSTSNGNCNQVTDNVVINFTNPPTVNAGIDFTICKNNTSSVLSGTVNGPTSTGIWTGGSGSYSPNNTALNGTYTPSASELAAGSTTLTLTSTNNGNCNQVTDLVIISFTNAPVVSAGTDIYTCKNNISTQLTGTVSGPTTTGSWVGGAGTFNPGSSALSTTYTPTTAEINAGFVVLTLQSTNNGNCNQVTDNIIINFTDAPNVNAGTNITACKNNAQVSLNGNVNGPTTTGIWQGGSGSYNPGNSTLNSFYTPSASEISAGSVTLTLNSTNNGNCSQVTDTVVVNFTNAPLVNAGPNLIICANNAVAALTGTVSGPTSTGMWSGGSGSYNPGTTSLSPNYTLSPSEISAGSATLVLTSTNNGNCNQTTDTVLITLSNGPSVFAGPDISVCANNPTISVNGSVSGGATTGVWSGSGSGAFAPSTTSLNTVYYLTPADVSLGTINIKLTSTNNGNCNAESDSLIVTITPKPNVDAGLNDTICSSNIFYPVNGSVTGGASAGTWSTMGNGAFGNSSNLNTTYTLGQADTLAGNVKLVLTSTGGNCLPETDTISIVIAKKPLVISGPDNLVCDNVQIQLNGTVSGLTTSGVWTTLGTGFFLPDDSLLTTYYQPSALDVSNGFVNLILTSTYNKGCAPEDDTTRFTFKPSPIADFNTNNICAKNSATFTDISSASTGSVTNWWWDFGDSNNSTTKNPTHVFVNPGTYTVAHVATSSNGCNDTVKKTIDVYFLPQAIFYQNAPCVGNNTQFVDSSKTLSGSLISWSWNFGDGTGAVIQNPSHAFSSASNYTVSLIVSTSYGCKDTLTKQVTVIPGPKADFNVNPNPLEALETAQFNDQSTGPASLVSWYWAFGDSTASNVQNPSHQYNNAGDMFVTLAVKDINGCIDTVRKEITVILLPDVPTAFTPNNDGQNDLFFVKGGPFKTINVRVYNNWGQLIFETNDQLQGWNGTFNGTEQPISVYVWVVEVEMLNGKKVKKTGDVTLLR